MTKEELEILEKHKIAKDSGMASTNERNKDRFPSFEDAVCQFLHLFVHGDDDE